jgi:hypothetical protein
MIKIDQKTYEDIRNKVGSEKMEQVERQSGICAELHQSAVEVASPPDTYRNQRNSVPEIKPEESDCVFEHEPVKMPSANELIKSLNDDKSRSSETGTCSNALTIPDPIPSVSVSQDDDLIIGKPDVVRANTQQIIELHNAILGCLRIGLEKAIAIGDLLFEQKKLIKFGKFTGWCRRNLPFCPRTAQRYMKLSMWKEQLSKKQIMTINEAYRLVEGEPFPDEIIDADESTNTRPKWAITSADVEVDSLSLPKKRAKGIQAEMAITRHSLDNMRNNELYRQGSYIKIVANMPSKQHTDLIAEFIVVASDLLKQGGKLILHKR